jgi:hypothetical protein
VLDGQTVVVVGILLSTVVVVVVVVIDVVADTVTTVIGVEVDVEVVVVVVVLWGTTPAKVMSGGPYAAARRWKARLRASLVGEGLSNGIMTLYVATIVTVTVGIEVQNPPIANDVTVMVLRMGLTALDRFVEVVELVTDLLFGSIPSERLIEVAVAVWNVVLESTIRTWLVLVIEVGIDLLLGSIALDWLVAAIGLVDEEVFMVPTLLEVKNEMGIETALVVVLIEVGFVRVVVSELGNVLLVVGTTVVVGHDDTVATAENPVNVEVDVSVDVDVAIPMLTVCVLVETVIVVVDVDVEVEVPGTVDCVESNAIR